MDAKQNCRLVIQKLIDWEVRTDQKMGVKITHGPGRHLCMNNQITYGRRFTYIHLLTYILWPLWIVKVFILSEKHSTLNKKSNNATGRNIVWANCRVITKTICGSHSFGPPSNYDDIPTYKRYKFLSVKLNDSVLMLANGMYTLIFA